MSVYMFNDAYKDFITLEGFMYLLREQKGSAGMSEVVVLVKEPSDYAPQQESSAVCD